jgi:putative heme-binding domain-containing protein
MKLMTVAMLASLTLSPIQAQRGGAGPNAGAANPFAGNEQAITEGHEIYNKVCTTCHGADGTAGDRAPALAMPGRRYIRQSDHDLFDAILKGIPGTPMPSTGLSENDSWKVAAYIRGLRGTAIDAPVKGDAAHGEQIFWGKGECGSCHTARGKGGLLGPDLSNVAGQRKLSSIRNALTKPDHRVLGDGGQIESVLYPRASYKAVRVVTKDGKTIRGVIRNEDSFSVQLMGTDNNLHMFARDEVKQIADEPKSFMPTDYDKRLTPAEFQDLLAYLSRLGVPAAPAAAPPAGRGGGGRGLPPAE